VIGGVLFIFPTSGISTQLISAKSQSGHICSKGGTRMALHLGHFLPQIFLSSRRPRKYFDSSPLVRL
jgi:hypothetical protein